MKKMDSAIGMPIIKQKSKGEREEHLAVTSLLVMIPNQGMDI